MPGNFKYVAGRIGARMTRAVAQEDTISWGVLDLLDAIEPYDLDRQEGQVRVVRDLQDTMGHPRRAQGPGLGARRVRLRAREVEGATSKLTQELRRPPTEAEIAREVGMEVAEYRGFLDRYSHVQVTSLESRLGTDGPPDTEHGALVEDPSVNPRSQANLEELRSQLVGAISELEERERLRATFYVYEGLTLKKIGKALDLTEGRMSQILRNAWAKLRKRLQGSAHSFGGWQEKLAEDSRRVL